MRELAKLGAASAVALVLFALSQMTVGLAQAGLFVAAAIIAVVAVGVATAVISDLLVANFGHRFKTSRATKCGSCGRKMSQIDVLWICVRCDRAAVAA